LHGFEHPCWLKRLDDEVLGTGLDRLDHQRLLAHRAAHQDLCVGIPGDDGLDGIDAAHVGHHDVHGDQVGLDGLVPLHRLQAALGLARDFIPGTAQNVRDHRAHEDRVVTNQDPVGHYVLRRETQAKIAAAIRSRSISARPVRASLFSSTTPSTATPNRRCCHSTTTTSPPVPESPGSPSARTASATVMIRPRWLTIPRTAGTPPGTRMIRASRSTSRTAATGMN